MRGWLLPIQAIAFISLIGTLVSLPILINPQGPLIVAELHLWDGPDPIRALYPDLSIVDGAVEVHEWTYPQFLLYRLAHGLAWAVVLIPVFYEASRLAKYAADEDPFTGVMFRRMRRLTVMVIAGWLLAESVEYAAARALFEIVMPADRMARFWAEPHYTFDVGLLWVGLILLAVTAMLHRGVKLRQELDTVI